MNGGFYDRQLVSVVYKDGPSSADDDWMPKRLEKGKCSGGLTLTHWSVFYASFSRHFKSLYKLFLIVFLIRRPLS